MSNFELINKRPFRLVAAENGRHIFGGPPQHAGIVPAGSRVGIQLVISLDLTDPLIPIKGPPGITKLPLYYPFKYGYGGPEIQYAVRSDSKIEILYLSDLQPDEKEDQYLLVDELPFAPMALEPLTYEQARAMSFRLTNSFFDFNNQDREAFKQIDLNNLVEIGGWHDHIVNAGDKTCRNRECEFFDRRVYFDAVALVPPIPINGDEEFWYQFAGEVTFCFGFCRYCGTVIAFNVAS